MVIKQQKEHQDSKKIKHKIEPSSRSSSWQLNLVNPTNPTHSDLLIAINRLPLFDHATFECNAINDSSNSIIETQGHM